VIDADLSHDPEALGALVAPVALGEVDVAIGSRYGAGGVVREWTWRRALISRTATAIARRFAATTDPLSGFFCCRRPLLDGSELPLRPRGFKILLEVLGRGGSEIRTLDVPIEFRDRERGKSKFGLRQIQEFVIQCAALAASRLSRRRRVGRTSSHERRPVALTSGVVSPNLEVL